METIGAVVLVLALVGWGVLLLQFANRPPLDIYEQDTRGKLLDEHRG